MTDLLLRRNRTGAGAAGHEAREEELVFSFSLFLSSVAHDLLAIVEQFLCDDRFVDSFVHFAVETDGTVVDGVLQHSLDAGHGEYVVTIAAQAHLLHRLCECFERVVAGSVQLEHFANEVRFVEIGINASRLAVVYVSERRKRRPQPLAQLLSVSSLDVFTQLIDIQFALSERDLEHELPMR